MGTRMEPQIDKSKELDQIYAHRFDAHVAYRNEVWKVLTRKFFSRYVHPESHVLDLGCGYGEFINNIQCAKKYAMDLNRTAAQHLSPNISFIEQDCSTKWNLADGSLDVVFTSNFFEHLPSRAALGETLNQARRCLREGGRIIALGPNIKFVGGAYWDFWDHHIALTDVALREILEIQGFRVEAVFDRFLPYTMVNRRKYSTLLVSLYLRVPMLWKLIGKQFLVVARKGSAVSQ